jgi:transposase InsO family protein
MNHKHVQRLCRDEGLRVRAPKRKRAHIGTLTYPADRAVATYPHRVRSWFLVRPETDARVLKLLTITDEFPEIALAIEVERSLTSDDMVRVLERLVSVHGTPSCIRMDNGAEMTDHALPDWCRFAGTGAVFIEPGSPWQNAYVESFNGKIRDELLANEEFTTLSEARIMTEDSRQHYNQQRPHSILNYQTPDEFTLNWRHNNPGLEKNLAH